MYFATLSTIFWAKGLANAPSMKSFCISTTTKTLFSIFLLIILVCCSKDAFNCKFNFLMTFNKVLPRKYLRQIVNCFLLCHRLWFFSFSHISLQKLFGGKVGGRTLTKRATISRANPLHYNPRMGAGSGLEPLTFSLWGWQATVALPCMVGETGFEPATLCSQGIRTTKLCYSPIIISCGLM